MKHPKKLAYKPMYYIHRLKNHRITVRKFKDWVEENVYLLNISSDVYRSRQDAWMDISQVAIEELNNMKLTRTILKNDIKEAKKYLLKKK